MTFPQQVGGSGRTQAFSIDLFTDGSSISGGMFFGTANFGDSISLTSTNDADGFIAKLDSNGSFDWATKIGGTSSVRVSDVSALSDGSSIITGLWNGTATFGGTTLTTNPTNYNDGFIAKLDSNGNFLWVTQVGSTQSDEPAAITTLSDGSSLVTGSFSGTVTFGSTSLTSTNNLREIFITKLNADGDFVWATKAGGGGHDHGKDIVALSDGSSIITGDFASSATFGSVTLQEYGSSSAFITKIDADGNFVWSTKAGEPNCCSSDSVYGYGVSALNDGSSLFTGKFKGSVSFGDNTLTSQNSSDDIFVAKVDSDGNFVWVTQAGGTSTELGQSITVLSDGSSLITGQFQGTATFGSTTLSSAGSSDIFVAKLDANGNFLWATKAGGTSSDYGIDLAALSDGSSIITGDINGTASFGSDDLTSPGSSDAFVAAMSVNGSWSSLLVSKPTISSASYNVSTGTLEITGTNFSAYTGSTNDIDISKLTITGNGGSTYVLTSEDVEITSSTEFSITLNAADQLQLAGLLNKNGTSSGAGTTYNIAAADDWAPGADTSTDISDLTGNAITVSNVLSPSLTSATYDTTTGILSLIGSNLPAYPGTSNDIDVSKLTITGDGGSTYTLTSTDVELTSNTSASITLNSSDQTNLVSLLNKNGNSSSQGTTYNIAAANNWVLGADAAINIEDLTSNSIDVINIKPTITGPSGSAGSSTSTKSVDENTTSVYTFSANETVTWSLNGGADSSLFSINSSSGALSFASAPDYESPNDSDSNNTYVVVVRATDSSSNSSDQTLTISVSDVDDNPTYSLSTSINVPQENYSLTTTVNTSYIDTGTTLFWSIGGTNVNLADFSTGALTGSNTVGNDGTFSFTHFIANDGAIEGYETFDIKLFSDYGRTIQIGDTKSVHIRDSAITEQIAEINKELSTINAILSVGQLYTLNFIRDFDGNLHGNSNEVADVIKSSYKYQGLLDVNNDGTNEAIYTNKESSRWVTASVDSTTGNADFTNYGQDGTTRVVGIYIDPLVTSGDVVQGSDHDSQRRFQNDLHIDNLIVKTSGDYDNDGFQEVYWKTNDETAYLRALMYADGNIKYANYQNEDQMSDYLTSKGFESVIGDII